MRALSSGSSLSSLSVALFVVLSPDSFSVAKMLLKHVSTASVKTVAKSGDSSTSHVCASSTCMGEREAWEREAGER